MSAIRLESKGALSALLRRRPDTCEVLLPIFFDCPDYDYLTFAQYRGLEILI